MNTFLLLAVIVFIAIVIDFYLIKQWKNYKNRSKENKQKETSISNSRGWVYASIKSFFRLAIVFIFGFVTIGIILLREKIWISGMACLFFGLFIFALKYGSVEISNDKPLETYVGFDNIKSVFKYPRSIYWYLVFILSIFSIYATSPGYSPPYLIRSGEIAWIMSITLGMVMMFWNQILDIRRIFSSLFTKVGKHQKEILIVTLILCLGVFLRTYMLAEHPYPWSGDEMSVGINGREILTVGKYNLFETGWSAQPNWSFLPTAISMKLFGDNIYGIRLASAIPAVLAILFTYLVAREMFNRTIAVISAAFLATFPYHLHFSRIGVHNIIDSLMSALTFWLIVKASKKNDFSLFYLAGAVAGLCVYTYAGTKLVPFLGFFLLLVYLPKNVTLPMRLSYLMLFVVATVIGVAPQIANSSHNMGILVGRLSAESIFLNGWLEEQVAITGLSVSGVIFTQFIKNFSVFTILPTTRTFFFDTSQPYLTILGSTFFLLGMMYAGKNIFKKNSFAILFWYFAVVMIGGALTIGAPANTRMLMSTPPVAMFIGIGIFLCVEAIKKSITISPNTSRNVLWLIVCALLIQNTYFYMVKLKNNYYFQTDGGEFSMEVGSIIKNKYPDYQVFLISSPIFSDFPTFEYTNPARKLIDLNDIEAFNLVLEKNKDYAFFATPNHSQAINQIMEKYPNGEHGFFYRKSNTLEILYEYYILEYK